MATCVYIWVRGKTYLNPRVPSKISTGPCRGQFSLTSNYLRFIFYLFRWYGKAFRELCFPQVCRSDMGYLLLTPQHAHPLLKSSDTKPPKPLLNVEYSILALLLVLQRLPIHNPVHISISNQLSRLGTGLGAHDILHLGPIYDANAIPGAVPRGLRSTRPPLVLE
jgi:hypothetical protein